MYGSWIINNLIVMLANLGVTLYFGQRFLRVIWNHRKLVTEIMEFNSIVRESRSSLDYTAKKVSEAMEEIENDINLELDITRNLTILSGKMSNLLGRFSGLEERVIELVRTNTNMESITISTPSDINYEIKNILKRKNRLSDKSPSCM